MVWVEGKKPGSKSPIFEPFSFDPEWDEDGGESFRVRNLITKLVRESVRDFRLREGDTALRALTKEEIQAAAAKGKIGRPREEAQTVDIDQAIGQALQAFEDGLYLLFVDDEEKRSLEDLVFLGLDTKITIIRLAALAGR